MKAKLPNVLLLVSNRPTICILFLASIICRAQTAGYIYTVAGVGYQSSTACEGCSPTSDPEQFAYGVAVDSSQNIYFADNFFGRVRELSHTTGLVSTIAGGGTSTADGVAGTSANLTDVQSIALDGQGNLLITDVDHFKVRKLNLSTGIITTVAGNGTQGSSGNGGLATSAELENPYGVAFDNVGNIYISDFGNDTVRKVSASTGIITAYAGNGFSGYSGDGGAATSAELFGPFGIAFDANNNLYIADTYNCVVREVTYSTGIISTFAGIHGQCGTAGDGGAAASANLDPFYIAFNSTGDLFITDFGNTSHANCRIRKIAMPAQTISTVGGATVNGSSCGYNGDDISATSALLNGPSAIAFDAYGNLYIEDVDNYRLREIYELGIPSGVPDNGQIVFSPNPVSFASTAVGSSSASQLVTVTNETGHNLTGFTLTPTDSTDFPMSSNNCTSSFAFGTSCTFELTFTPKTTGSLTETVTGAGNSQIGPYSAILSVSGTGTSSGSGGTGTTVTASVNIMGTEQCVIVDSSVVGLPTGNSINLCDYGTVSVTAGGFTASATFGPGSGENNYVFSQYDDSYISPSGVMSTSTSVASALAAAFNASTSSGVSATNSGATLILTNKSGYSGGIQVSVANANSSVSDDGGQLVFFENPSFLALPVATVTGSGGINIVGSQECQTYADENGDGGNYTACDYGTISITAGGYTVSTGYGSTSSSVGPAVSTSSTPTTIASSLATQFNAASSSPVSASASGSSLVLTSKSGYPSKFTLSAIVSNTPVPFDSQNDTTAIYYDFPPFYFVPIPTSTFTSTGGVNISGTEQCIIGSGIDGNPYGTTSTACDYGTVSLTVSGFTASYSYGAPTGSPTYADAGPAGLAAVSTPSSIAAGLAAVFNNSSSSPVTATAAGGNLSLSSKAGSTGVFTVAATVVNNPDSSNGGTGYYLFSFPSFIVMPNQTTP